MSSKTSLDKKRVARVGNKKENVGKTPQCEEDIVSKIMNDMEKKIITYKDLEELREHNQNSYPHNKEITMGVKQTKKYSLSKKHPLMEKCQKNLKYLKHNRSIPKQRAHVGEISTFKNINEKIKPIEKPKYTKVLNKEKKIEKNAETFSKIEPQKYSFLPVGVKEKSKLLSKFVNNQAVSKVCEQSSRNSNCSSDSDSEFEKFVSVQKEDLLESSSSEIERAFKKRKTNQQKPRKKGSAFNALNKKSAVRKRKLLYSSSSEAEQSSRNLNCSFKSNCELENSSSESSSCEIKRAFKKCKKNKQKLRKKGTEFNALDRKSAVGKQELSDSSEIESSESQKYKRTITKPGINSSNESSKIEKTSKKYKRRSSSSGIEGTSKMHKRKKQKSEDHEFNVAKTTLDKKLEDCDESDFETSESLSFNLDVSSDSDSTATVLNVSLETDNNSRSSESNRSNSKLCLDLTKADIDSYISKNFSCAVRVLRNPILDQIVISSLKYSDKSNIALSFDINKFKSDEYKTNIENPRDIKVNSNEDDCIIIGEVSRSNSTPPFKENCRGESVLPCYSLSYDYSNTTILHPISDFKPDNKSSPELKNSAEQDISTENYKECANKSINEFEIQILSVESLNIPSNDISADNVQTSISGKKVVCNKSLSNIVQLPDNSTNYTKNKIFDSKKDFFKYAKIYSEPQNCNNDIGSINSSINNLRYKNSQITPKDSTSNSVCIPKTNECLSKINFELINCTKNQSSCSEIFSNNCDNIISDKNPLESTESAKHFNVVCDEILNESKAEEDACIKDKLILPPHVLEMAQKLDFEKVLTLSKPQQNKTTDNQLDWNINSFNQSSTNSQKNLMTNSSHQSMISPPVPNLCVSSANKVNIKKEKLTPHHKLGTQSLESSSHYQNTYKTLVENYLDSPSEELDVIATKNILDLDEQKQSITPLIKMYFAELKKFKEIESAENTVSEGLNILIENQRKKVTNLEQAVQSFLQHDPCYRKILESSKIPKTVKSIDEKSKQHNISGNQKPEICSNCGLQAKMKCLGCEKELFCSEKCGMEFWENGHASSCQKTTR